MVNGRVAKASVDVKPGDIIEVGFGSNLLKVKVLSVADAVKKDEASGMYEVVQ